MIELKKGDKVILKGFTGIKLGVFEISSATKKTVTVTKKNGDELIFDRKTGRQINVEEGKEKYANSIIEDDGSFVAPTRGPRKKKAAKKPAAKPAPVDDDIEEDEDDEADEEEEAEEPVKPKKGKKTKKAAPAKKPTKKPADDDEDDEWEDEFEEVDD